MRTPIFKLNPLFAAVFASFSAVPAVAQDAAEVTLPVLVVVDDAENDTGYAVGQIRTATKTATALQDVPQAVGVVTRELAQDQAMQTMADVVRYVPGVGMAQGEGHRDAPIFRGNTSTSDFFVDGLRDDVQYFRDLYSIERVEVLKGPNAMIFGRGGVGGVINRVTRKADGQEHGELNLSVGSWDHKRVSIDAGEVISPTASARVTGVYEDSDSYRNGMTLERYGINPTLLLNTGPRTTVLLGFEYFNDERVTDRGGPSFQGKPFAAPRSTFFGDPNQSPATLELKAFSAVIDHDFGGGLSVRNSTYHADYSRAYQNVFASGPYAPATDTVPMQAYFSNTDRQNVFNQTDLTWAFKTGPVQHTLLAGLELGRQVTDNLRMTGEFAAGANVVTDANNSTIRVPASMPTFNANLVRFFQSSNSRDGNNEGVTRIASVYVQDQVAFTPKLLAVAGVRYDHFDVDFQNRRTDAGATPFLSSNDDLLSPRLGLIYKLVTDVSVYTSYSVSYLPRAGEQLASLSVASQALEPEEFINYEIGAKWSLTPALAATLAVYELQRNNVDIPNPSGVGRLLADGQVSRGAELDLSGRLTAAWSVMAGYAYQDTELTETASATALKGAALGQVPQHSASLWNRYDFTQRWGAGLGVSYIGKRFTTTSNTVTLDSYTRVDAAVYCAVTPQLKLQLNVENLLDEDYYASAHNDNNILPGSPVSVKLGVTLTL